MYKKTINDARKEYTPHTLHIYTTKHTHAHTHKKQLKKHFFLKPHREYNVCQMRLQWH